MQPRAVKLYRDLTPQQAAALPPFSNPTAEAERLELALTPAAPSEAMDVLQYLFRVLPMENRGETDEEKDENAMTMVAAYASVMSAYPRWAIVEVRGDFMSGRVNGQSLEFAPKPPQLGHELARRVSAYHEKLRRMTRQAEECQALAREERRPLSAEARELGRRRIEELRAIGAQEARRVNGRASAPGYVDPNPITREALEAAKVPDAPSRRTDTSPFQRAAPPAFDPMSRRASR